MRATTTTMLLLAASTSAAHASDDWIDEGVDEPVPGTWSTATETGPDGSYGHYADLRFRVTSGSGSWASARTESDWYGNETFEYHPGTIREEVSFRLDLVGSFGLRKRGGFYFGAGIEHARAHGTLVTNHASRSIYAAHLLLGYAKPIGSKFQLELGGLGQLGGATVRETFEGSLTPTLSGMHGAVGAETSLVYIDQSGWELAITASARHSSASLSDPHEYSVGVSGSSTGVGAFIGKRY